MIEPWTQTRGGKRFDTFDPKPEQFDIFDIATALSRICRFNGHTIKFYSVAEHCVLMAGAVSKQNKFSALMHDVSEAYLPDMPGPIKGHFKSFIDAENVIMNAAADRYRFAWPLPDEVNEADARILMDEKAQAMEHEPCDWGINYNPLGVRLKFWKPERACQKFVEAAIRFTPHAGNIP